MRIASNFEILTKTVAFYMIDSTNQWTHFLREKPDANLNSAIKK